MTLSEYLGSLPKNKIVAIGSKRGSSYFYFGKAGDTELIKKAYADELDRRLNIEIRYFKPILEYEVLDTFHKEIDDCLAILVDGKISARFWLKSEFDTVYKAS